MKMHVLHPFGHFLLLSLPLSLSHPLSTPPSSYQHPRCSSRPNIVECSDIQPTEPATKNESIVWGRSTPFDVRVRPTITADDEGELVVTAEVVWRIPSYPLLHPIQEFEVLLRRLVEGSEDEVIEAQRMTLNKPIHEPHRTFTLVDFFLSFASRLQFGEEYIAEVRYLPFGEGGVSYGSLTLPPLENGGHSKCVPDSAAAILNHLYQLSFAAIVVHTASASVDVAVHLAPAVFCLKEYTLRIVDDNEHIVYAQVFLRTANETRLLRYTFEELPRETEFFIKLSAAERDATNREACVCLHCNCPTTISRPIIIPPRRRQMIQDFLAPSSPPLTVSPESSSSTSLWLILLLSAILVLLIAIIAFVLLLFLILRERAALLQQKRLKLMSNSLESDDSEKLMSGRPLLKRLSLPYESSSHRILVVGLNTEKELGMALTLMKKASTFSSEIVFAPLHSSAISASRLHWARKEHEEAHSIIVVHSLLSYSFFHSPHSLAAISRDPFNVLFIEQIGLLHPADPRILHVSLEASKPPLLFPAEMVFEWPRDLDSLSSALFSQKVPFMPIMESSPHSLLPLQELDESSEVRKEESSSLFSSSPSLCSSLSATLFHLSGHSSQVDGGYGSSLNSALHPPHAAQVAFGLPLTESSSSPRKANCKIEPEEAINGDSGFVENFVH